MQTTCWCVARLGLRCHHGKNFDANCKSPSLLVDNVFEVPNLLDLVVIADQASLEVPGHRIAGTIPLCLFPRAAVANGKAEGERALGQVLSVALAFQLYKAFSSGLAERCSIFGIHDHLEVQLRAAWTRHLELRGDQDLRLVVELVGIHHPVDVLHVRRTADLLGLMKHVHPESIPEPVDVRECRRNFRDLVALREQVFLAEFDDLLLRNFLTCLWKKAVHGHNWRRERKLRCRAFPRPIR
mmetsp:Transcript_31104/g.72972  ORF Transcript_31104/g.72972 Transcript_31104/m.72972 type:complete len:241 (-) Transcript_31104:738-1460(-)